MRSSILSNAFRSLAIGFGLAVVSVSSLVAQGPCASTLSVSGPAQIGTQITLTITGSAQCHSCIWVSKNQGPTQIGPVTIPIGIPLLNAIDYGPLPPSGTLSLPLSIPNDPNLIGLQLYFTNVAYPQGGPPTLTNIEFSPALVLTFVP